MSARAGAIRQLKGTLFQAGCTHISYCAHGLEDLRANGETRPCLRIGDMHVEHVQHVRDELAEPPVDLVACHPSAISGVELRSYRSNQKHHSCGQLTTSGAT